MRVTRGTSQRCAHTAVQMQSMKYHMFCLDIRAPVMAGCRGQQADDRRQSRLHVLVHSIERSRWIDKWVNGDQKARDRRHVSISTRLLLVSVKDNIGTSIDSLSPENKASTWCSAHPSNPCCHQGYLHASRASLSAHPDPSARTVVCLLTFLLRTT